MCGRLVQELSVARERIARLEEQQLDSSSRKQKQVQAGTRCAFPLSHLSSDHWICRFFGCVCPERLVLGGHAAPGT